MIVGMKVQIPFAKEGICEKDQIAEITYLCEDGKRVLLNIGYFHEIKDLVFVDAPMGDPYLFAKYIKKHGSLFAALKNSL